MKENVYDILHEVKTVYLTIGSLLEKRKKFVMKRGENVSKYMNFDNLIDVKRLLSEEDFNIYMDFSTKISILAHYIVTLAASYNIYKIGDSPLNTVVFSDDTISGDFKFDVVPEEEAQEFNDTVCLKKLNNCYYMGYSLLSNNRYVIYDSEYMSLYHEKTRGRFIPVVRINPALEAKENSSRYDVSVVNGNSIVLERRYIDKETQEETSDYVLCRDGLRCVKLDEVEGREMFLDGDYEHGESNSNKLLLQKQGIQ